MKMVLFSFQIRIDKINRSIKLGLIFLQLHLRINLQVHFYVKYQHIPKILQTKCQMNFVPTPYANHLAYLLS